MDAIVLTVIEEYQSRLDQEAPIVRNFDMGEYIRRRDAFLLGVGAETGTFLNILIKAKRPRTILEVGTSYGYSTLWLAEAARAVGARVISLEVSEDKTVLAKQMIARAGLQSSVEFVVGDALEKIPTVTGTIDFALIDLWKELYIPSFDRLYPKLSDGALVAADNVIFPVFYAESAAEYISHVRSQPGIESVTVPIGSGIELSYYSKPGATKR
ncbi:MAG TPA: class I SAM-dependent methyltransferase [Patescibacteria group bacterium]|nr:class I SAM-dependent methyltransferase [Patescibacteria group bacterium]